MHPADIEEVTAHLSQDPAALQRALEPDVLGWLGFEHGEPDQPLLDWPRPQGWLPVLPRRRVARNSAPAPAA